MSKWQDISTAPKDGTALLSWDGVGYAIVRWCSCNNAWQLPNDDQTGWEYTHWMFLPEPPE